MQGLVWFGWLYFTSQRQVIWRRHPHSLSLAKVMKLGFYTVPTGNRTPGHRVAVHYTTAVPRMQGETGNLLLLIGNTFLYVWCVRKYSDVLI